MNKYTDNPHDFTNIDSLYELHLYKLHNNGIGEVNQSLDDYIELNDIWGQWVVAIPKDS